MSNRILITGASGFTGQYVADVLRRRGDRVIGASRSGVIELPHQFDEVATLKESLQEIEALMRQGET